LTKQKSTR